MSKPLKPRRGTTAEHASFIGEAHEVTYDTDKQTLVTHDGLTAGGFPLAKEEEVSSLDTSLRSLIAEEAAKCLKTSGGTMKGEIVRDGDLVRGATDSGELTLRAGTGFKKGGDIVFFGIDASDPAYAGSVLLRAYSPDGASEISLHLTGDSLRLDAIDLPMPSGAVMAFAANSAPSGYLLCNGAAVSRTTYAKLFKAIGTTYGAGDGTSTFNLPNLTDRFIQGSGTAGTVMAAGLPNIHGRLALNRAHHGISINTEAFKATKAYGSSATASDGSGVAGDLDVQFWANDSNAIYGASTTVQPPALTMRFYIKY